MLGDVDIQLSFSDGFDGGPVLDFSSLIDAASQDGAVPPPATVDAATDPVSVGPAPVDPAATPDAGPDPLAPPVDDFTAASGGSVDGSLGGAPEGDTGPGPSLATDPALNLTLADFHPASFGASWAVA